jgi:hypothetical protein
MGTPASKMSLGAVVLEQPQLNATRNWIELNWIYIHSVNPVQADTIGYGTSQY